MPKKHMDESFCDSKSSKQKIVGKITNSEKAKNKAFGHDVVGMCCLQWVGRLVS